MARSRFLSSFRDPLRAGSKIGAEYLAAVEVQANETNDLVVDPLATVDAVRVRLNLANDLWVSFVSARLRGRLLLRRIAGAAENSHIQAIDRLVSQRMAGA